MDPVVKACVPRPVSAEHALLAYWRTRRRRAADYSKHAATNKAYARRYYRQHGAAIAARRAAKRAARRGVSSSACGSECGAALGLQSHP